MPQGEVALDLQLPTATSPVKLGKVSYLYTGATIKDLRDGYIGALNVDKIALASDQSVGAMTGLINGYTSADSLAKK